MVISYICHELIIYKLFPVPMWVYNETVVSGVSCCIVIDCQGVEWRVLTWRVSRLDWLWGKDRVPVLTVSIRTPYVLSGTWHIHSSRILTSKSHVKLSNVVARASQLVHFLNATHCTCATVVNAFSFFPHTERNGDTSKVDEWQLYWRLALVDCQGVATLLVMWDGLSTM